MVNQLHQCSFNWCKLINHINTFDYSLCVSHCFSLDFKMDNSYFFWLISFFFALRSGTHLYYQFKNYTSTDQCQIKETIFNAYICTIEKRFYYFTRFFIPSVCMTNRSLINPKQSWQSHYIVCKKKMSQDDSKIDTSLTVWIT